MTSNTAVVRLARDYSELIRDPLPNIRAAPSPDNMLNWHFIFVGGKDTGFEGGYYHGVIKFVKEYPFKPPFYSMHIESGRFVLGKDICITNSSYHTESWNPLWSISGILTGFVAFFHDTKQIHFIGSASNQSDESYVKFAKETPKKIIENKILNELFPDVIEQIKAEQNGRPLCHTLPFPPEYYVEKERQEKHDQCNMAEINYEAQLQYDSYDESDGEE
ncbi:UBC core domain-containing protein [Aphelenchoides bicaudatus]|nr:UBC core domain-containing protein [Aphelenchoides bicaudatus]